MHVTNEWARVDGTLDRRDRSDYEGIEIEKRVSPERIDATNNQTLNLRIQRSIELESNSLASLGFAFLRFAGLITVS